MKLMPLEQSKIVLTGGAGGIGALVAREFRALGAYVLVVDRLEPPVGDERYLRGDLSTMSGICTLADQLRLEAPNILINLAGAQYFGPAEDQPSAHVHCGYMVNLLAPVLLTQAVLPVMKRRASGQIVNIGSIFGSINYPHFATYSSAKAGLRGFSEALRRELHGSGIDVTYIAPRAVRTALNNSLVMRFAELAKMRMDEPEAVARRIVRAIRDRQADVFIGARERFFVRVNAVLPRLVDSALSGQTTKARKLFTP
jgi:short-subunit dehydrogenase